MDKGIIPTFRGRLLNTDETVPVREYVLYSFFSVTSLSKASSGDPDNIQKWVKKKINPLFITCGLKKLGEVEIPKIGTKTHGGTLG